MVNSFSLSLPIYRHGERTARGLPRHHPLDTLAQTLARYALTGVVLK